MTRISNKVRILFATLAITALPAVAAAKPVPTAHTETPRKTARKIVAEHDLNGDLRMSSAEWKAARRDHMIERLRQFDRNRNGSISRFEAWLHPDTRVHRYFWKIDRNDDGRLTLVELLASPDLLWGRSGTRKLVKQYGPRRY